jgi:hypothetical protein
MSNLLSQASLVMIPSGYKEDVVYSQIPTSGAGDLSFTRASNGTRVNSAGLVEVCPWNLLTNSENFSADFTPINSSISNNTTTAPNGTTTADSLIENTATDNHFAFADSTQLNGTQYTYSVYAKSIGGRNIRVFGSSGFGGDVIVDLANGSVLSGSGVVENVGNGWYRISITATTTTTTVRAILYAVNGTSTSYTGNGTSGVFLWGAQLNIGSTAKPYFPTTDRLNVPRLTYQNGGGGCPSLLLEKQSTNVILYSEDFSNSTYWVIANSVVSANATTSPDGTQNADLWYPSTNGDVSSRRLLQSCTVSTSGVNITATVYVKRNNKRWLFFVGPDATSANHNCWFDIQNGVVGTQGSAVVSATIESAGNGWYRCSVTSLANSTTQYIFLSATDSDADGTVTANGTDGFYFYGAQVEVSSYPTSYIPTTSSSATRVADACSKTGISSLIGQTEGVLFVDYNYDAKPDVNGNVAMVIYDGSNEAYIFITGGGALRLELYNGGGLQCLLTTSIGAIGRKKIAFAYKQNDFVGYMNGVQIATDTSGTVGAMSNLYVGSYYTANYNANGGINQSALFPTRLSNSELASLTTI